MLVPNITSHPIRGAWIEIAFRARLRELGIGRTPYGVRGLKWRSGTTKRGDVCRTPYGVRGLKFFLFRGGTIEGTSHPIRGAWIEIVRLAPVSLAKRGRTPYGVRGLKCKGDARAVVPSMSHPIRGAWIEMPPT